MQYLKKKFKFFITNLKSMIELSFSGKDYLFRHLGHQQRGEFDLGDSPPELLPRVHLQRRSRRLQGLPRHDRAQWVDGTRPESGKTL